MAVVKNRSNSGSLMAGATDGKYRKSRPDTSENGGPGDDIVTRNRNDLHPFYNYGYVTSQAESNKVNPGGC